MDDPEVNCVLSAITILRLSNRQEREQIFADKNDAAAVTVPPPVHREAEFFVAVAGFRGFRGHEKAGSGRPKPALQFTQRALPFAAHRRVFAVAMALADYLGTTQFGLLVAGHRPLGFASLLVDFARFDEFLLRLVVLARRGAVAFAFVAPDFANSGVSACPAMCPPARLLTSKRAGHPSRFPPSRKLTIAGAAHRAIRTGICASMMMCRVPPPKIIWRMRLWV